MSALSVTSLKSTSLLARSMLSAEPSYLVVFVTAVCNCRCPMCFYWEEIDSANAKLELHLEEYQRISQNLHYLYYLSIGGGEPFIRKDLPQLVQTFYENSRTRVVTVSTNGSFPDRVQQYVEYLAEHCPGIQMRVQVSIDNLYEKHDQNRRLEGLFERLLDTCRVIEAAKGAGAPLMFSVGTVLTPFNRDDLMDLRTFLDENVAFDDLSLIYPRGNAQDPRFKRVTLAEYQQAQKAFEATRANPGSFACLYQAIDRQAKRGIEGYLGAGPDGYPWACVAGKKMITLTEKGLLRPCEMLCQIKPDIDSTLGDVREHDYDIPRMLASDEAKQLRKFVKQTHCSCSYECAAMCNVVFHKKRWPALAKETLKG